jgi:hypothetical protein
MLFYYGIPRRYIGELLAEQEVDMEVLPLMSEKVQTRDTHQPPLFTAACVDIAIRVALLSCSLTQLCSAFQSLHCIHAQEFTEIGISLSASRKLTNAFPPS